ncbi:MAG: Uma2 family endonuclease [Treponema sp.]|nr:Uma2 family endonuclease [Treponema sp.]
MSEALNKDQVQPNPFAGRKNFTYKDYLNWPEDLRVEIINGVAYMMSPPATVHQRVSMQLSKIFANFLEENPCEVFAAPFGVRLFPKEDHSDDTVVEPDIVVICDLNKIDERGCNGPPDLVIEILSPSTSRKDRFQKLELYKKAKVREYWIVSPENREIEVNIFENNKINVYGKNDDDTPDDLKLPELAPVFILPGLEINLKEVF